MARTVAKTPARARRQAETTKPLTEALEPALKEIRASMEHQRRRFERLIGMQDDGLRRRFEKVEAAWRSFEERTTKELQTMRKEQTKILKQFIAAERRAVHDAAKRQRMPARARTAAKPATAPRSKPSAAAAKTPRKKAAPKAA